MAGSDWLVLLESGYILSVIMPSLPTLWKLDVMVSDLVSHGLLARDLVRDLRGLWKHRFYVEYNVERILVQRLFILLIFNVTGVLRVNDNSGRW